MSADFSSGGWVRLSDWGRQFGRVPRVSWQMMRDGRFPKDLEVQKIGCIYYVRSRSEVVASGIRTVLYARVSSSVQSADLIRQVGRVQVFARKSGWVVDEVVMETASGMNGKRRKLLRVLGGGGAVRLVVEHRGRLARFGFEMVEAAVRGAGGEIVVREIVVMEDGEVEDDLVRDVTEVLTSFCARLYGRRSAARRAEKALQAASV